jgi:ATP-binding cassette subfamily B protein
MQDVFLFTSTIRDNITYGSAKASDQEIIQAAKVAQMHDFIESLPQGYNTWVGERGFTISGGQRQRLAIARTLLLNPPVLVLDDSTSSVDSQTEHQIRLAINKLTENRTTFVIAHRLSTVHKADIILVLDNGQIIEKGTHTELLAKSGKYREIYELQLKPQAEI